jgi:23S rRNA (adenine2503-C2)-methyltransferase
MLMDESKYELIGVSLKNLEKFFVGTGEKPFRAKQISKWIYSANMFDFAQMTDIPTPLRFELAEIASVTLPATTQTFASDDGATKFLFELTDGTPIETVYIPDPEAEKNTVCVSSQAGCKFGCTFCATGKSGFTRNLTSSEIVGQLFAVRDYISTGGKNLTNVVFMGMGEPLDNLDAVIESIRVFVSEYGFGLGHRRILISTVGVPDGIARLLDCDLRPKLAVSLNAPNDELRSQLMPANVKYPIASWIGLVKKYAEHSKRWVTFEYALIAGVNDSLEHATQLFKLIRNLPCKVNLIPLNKIDNCKFDTPDQKIVERFQSFLLSNGIVATIRRSKGGSVGGACGQLAAKEFEVLN